MLPSLFSSRMRVVSTVGLDYEARVGPEEVDLVVIHPREAAQTLGWGFGGSLDDRGSPGTQDEVRKHEPTWRRPS